MAAKKKQPAKKAAVKKTVEHITVKAADVSYISDGAPVTSNPISYTVKITTIIPVTAAKRGKKK